MSDVTSPSAQATDRPNISHLFLGAPKPPRLPTWKWKCECKRVKQPISTSRCLNCGRRRHYQTTYTRAPADRSRKPLARSVRLIEKKADMRFNFDAWEKWNNWRARKHAYDWMRCAVEDRVRRGTWDVDHEEAVCNDMIQEYIHDRGTKLLLGEGRCEVDCDFPGHCSQWRSVEASETATEVDSDEEEKDDTGISPAEEPEPEGPLSDSSDSEDSEDDSSASSDSSSDSSSSEKQVDAPQRFDGLENDYTQLDLGDITPPDEDSDDDEPQTPKSSHDPLSEENLSIYLDNIETTSMHSTTRKRDDHGVEERRVRAKKA